MFQTHLNYFSSLLPIKSVGFLKKKKGKKSIICSCRCAYIYIDTSKKVDAFVSNPQWRQYPKSLSKKAKYLPLQKSGLYKFSLWDRLKQKALCNTLWCLGMMSASRLAGMWEELKAPCQIQTSKLAVPDTSPWEACELILTELRSPSMKGWSRQTDLALVCQCHSSKEISHLFFILLLYEASFINE